MILVPTLSGGGAEREATRLSRYLPGNVIVVTYERGGAGYPHGGTVVSLNAPGGGNPVAKGIALIRRALKVRRLKKTHRIDVSISFMDGPNVLNLLSATGERTYVGVQNYTSLTPETRGLNGWFYRTLIRLLYNRATAVVPNSHESAEDLIREFGVRRQKVRVICNSCEIEMIHAAAAEPLPDDAAMIFRRPVILTMGRLHEQKAQWALLQAHAEVIRNHRTVRLVLLGQGALLEALMRFGRELGLCVAAPGAPVRDEHDVVFTGFVANPWRYLAKATIFALPSRYEGLPNVVIEAMACGVPVVAANCPSGPRELLAPGTPLLDHTTTMDRADFGILMPVPQTCGVPESPRPPDDTERAWASCLAELLHDAALRQKYADAGRRRARDFDMSKALAAWGRLFLDGPHESPASSATHS